MSTENEKQNIQKPWYKHPWPWGLMAGPAIVVVAGITTFSIAMDTEDTLVSDDYYKEGKNIIMQIERDQYADAQQINAKLFVQPKHDGVKVIMAGSYDPAVKLKLSFIHPTLKKYDQTIELKQTSNSQYTAQLPEPLAQAERWLVRIEDGNNQWKIENRWEVKTGDSFTLQTSYTDALKNIKLARDHYALEHQISAQLDVLPKHDGVTVALFGDFDPKIKMLLSFIHPSLKKHDQTVVLRQTGKNQYTAQLPTPLAQADHWLVRIEDAKSQWTIENQWEVKKGSQLTLQATQKNAL